MQSNCNFNLIELENYLNTIFLLQTARSQIELKMAVLKFEMELERQILDSIKNVSLLAEVANGR